MPYKPTLTEVDTAGNLNHLVDKTIGNAYSVVREVYKNLPFLKFLADRVDGVSPIEFRDNPELERTEWKYMADLDTEWKVLITYDSLTALAMQYKNEAGVFKDQTSDLKDATQVLHDDTVEVKGETQALADLVQLLVDQINGVYYGALAEDPVLDPLGDPSSLGDYYYNDGSVNPALKGFRVFNADSEWEQIFANAHSVIYRTATVETALDDLNSKVVVYAETYNIPDTIKATDLAAGLADGATVIVDRDETRGGVEARYTVASGALVFANELDAGQIAATGGVSVQDKLDEIVAGAATQVQIDNSISTHNADAGAHPQLSALITSEGDRASTAADRAEVARDAALLSRGLWQTTAQGIDQGVAGVASIVVGSGGTNGTFVLAFSGGTQVIAPKGYFVVAGGAVTQVVITYSGHYSAGTPTLSFAASAGLTGASATAVMSANTPVGAYFSVPVSGSDDMLILYLVEAGPVATEITRYPSTAFIDNILLQTNQISGNVALFVDESGNVPVWLKDGLLGASGLTDELISFIFDREPDNAIAPLATNGKSTYRLKSKLAAIRAGATTQAKILFVGDSWTERTLIPQLFADALYAEFGEASTGWISTSSDRVALDAAINGVTFVSSGFTLLDVNAAATSLDLSARQATGTSATIAIGNLFAQSVDIYSYDGDGLFRYRVDGGSWVSVVGASTGNTTKTSITGLSDTAHTLDIDLTGNTGTVRLFGFYAKRTATGVEVSKAGNSGSTAANWQTYAASSATYLADINPDLIFVILGTNDSDTGVTPATFKSQMTAFLTAYTTAAPNASIVVVAPPDNGVAAKSILEGYALALFEISQELPMVELLNIEAISADYTEMNALGLWLDTKHLNSTGAQFIYDAARKYFII